MAERTMEEIIAGLPPISETRQLEFYKRHFEELSVAAWKVIEEMDHIHDTRPRPFKYGAPFGAIAELRTVLNKLAGLR